jgi:hypothetical protein
VQRSNAAPGRAVCFLGRFLPKLGGTARRRHFLPGASPSSRMLSQGRRPRGPLRFARNLSSITAAEPRVSAIAVPAAGAILPRGRSSEVASARRPAASPTACDRGSTRRPSPSPPGRRNTRPGFVRKCAGSLVETTASAIAACPMEDVPALRHLWRQVGTEGFARS